MPRQSLFSATLLIFVSLVAQASPLQAVPVNEVKSRVQPFDQRRAEAGSQQLEQWKTPTQVFTAPANNGNPAKLELAKRPFPDNDPCGFSQNWLAQQKNDIAICGSLADFYAPQVSSYPAAPDTGTGSRLALFMIGLFALILATRRPVWISHLMRWEKRSD